MSLRPHAIPQYMAHTTARGAGVCDGVCCKKELLWHIRSLSYVQSFLLASEAEGHEFAFGDLLEYFHRLAGQVMGGIIMEVPAVMVDWFARFGL